MSRIKLRCGGKPRKKAFLGAAISAGATLAAATMQALATSNAAKQQAKAIESSAQVNANALNKQNANNNKLQEQLIASNNQMNRENQDAMRDIILNNQMQAGNENLTYRQQANRMMVRNGGKSRRKLRNISYGGWRRPFKVTDGGAALPIQIDNNGYGLYELIGNDHEHYHKTNGKAKTGVGIKTPSGEIIEGEGNQNSNQGELVYATPEDIKFISKHSLKGFNPAQAVNSGMNPEEAFAYQEAIKNRFNINDSGNKAKCGKRVKAVNGLSYDSNLLDVIIPNTVAPSIVHPENIANLNNINTKKPSNKNIFNNNGGYTGAIINSVGNLGGAAISAWGNNIASRKLANAYSQAGDILANSYSQMKGIDLNMIKRENYDAPSVLAKVRSANTNINPMLERIDRNARAENREVNRGTLSSTARFNRFAGINDRRYQNYTQQYANKFNIDEQIKQNNIQTLNDIDVSNADRKVQANQSYTNAMLQGLMYNNNIENESLMGAAQARADALTQGSLARANSLQSSMQGFGNAIAASGQVFGDRYNYLDKSNTDFRNNWYGLGDQQQVDAALARNDKYLLNILYNKYKNLNTDASRKHLARISPYIKK